jgi:hypothetical protein
MPDEREREGQFDYRLFLRKNSSWLVVGMLALVIVVLFSMVMDSRRQVMAFEQRQLAVARTATATERTPQASLAVNPTAPSASPAAGSGTPVTGSLTEEEKHPVATGQFPNGSVQGSAIVQWWDGGSQCGIFLLREGETFTYREQGTWWQFSSQEAADARYPAHRSEYFTSNQGCHEGKPEE